MGKLIRMDLYRMLKSKSFLVCIILTFVLAMIEALLSRLLFILAKSLSSEINETFPAEVNLYEILVNPFPMMGMMLIMISLCYFYYADVENGYIKNIAGQMPMKGFTVLSKFMATVVHNLMFIVVGIIGSLIGTILVQKITMNFDVVDTIRILVLKLMLVQSLCAILLLAVATCQSKSLGMILAVLFGLKLTPVIYFGINEGLKQIFGPGTDIKAYMPDTVMSEKPLETVKALLVSIVTGVIFLVPAIRIFDRKDVK